MSGKEKMTKQVLISKRLSERLHIAAIKEGKTMREFLDELIERTLGADLDTDDPEVLPVIGESPPIILPRDVLVPDEIGSVSLRVSPVEESAPEDPEWRSF